MASPFPGMDPYLEGPEWPDFHSRFVNAWCEAIADHGTPRRRTSADWVSLAESHWLANSLGKPNRHCDGVTRTCAARHRSNQPLGAITFILADIPPVATARFRVLKRDLKERRVHAPLPSQKIVVVRRSTDGRFTPVHW